MPRRLAPVALGLLLTACIGGADTDSVQVGDPEWYTSCGDPACSGWTATDGVDLCTSQVEGDACEDLESRCDPQNDCNALLVCATSDPKDQEGGCPISLRSAKTGIQYLNAEQKRQVAERLLATPLATWEYRDPARGQGTKLGFILDDVPGSAAVDASGQRVDLYGYTSMTVATVQLQQQQIEALQLEVAELRGRLEAQQDR